MRDAVHVQKLSHSPPTIDREIAITAGATAEFMSQVNSKKKEKGKGKGKTTATKKRKGKGKARAIDLDEMDMDMSPIGPDVEVDRPALAQPARLAELRRLSEHIRP